MVHLPMIDHGLSIKKTRSISIATVNHQGHDLTSLQEGEIYELSEDISEELKLMGMEAMRSGDGNWMRGTLPTWLNFSEVRE